MRGDIFILHSSPIRGLNSYNEVRFIGAHDPQAIHTHDPLTPFPICPLILTLTFTLILTYISHGHNTILFHPHSSHSNLYTSHTLTIVVDAMCLCVPVGHPSGHVPIDRALRIVFHLIRQPSSNHLYSFGEVNEVPCHSVN